MMDGKCQTRKEHGRPIRKLGRLIYVTAFNLRHGLPTRKIERLIYVVKTETDIYPAMQDSLCVL